MSDEESQEEPQPTLASAIRFGRQWTGQSLRRLARSSGVSPAQLSRLEGGHVEAVDGDADQTRACAQFSPDRAASARRSVAWRSRPSGTPATLRSAANHFADEIGEDEYRRILTELDEASTEAQFRSIALCAYTLDASAVDWPAGLTSVMPASAPDSDLLRQVIEAWPEITPERRWRLVELARDMRDASLFARSMEQKETPDE